MCKEEVKYAFLNVDVFLHPHISIWNVNSSVNIAHSYLNQTNSFMILISSPPERSKDIWFGSVQAKKKCVKSIKQVRFQLT